MTLRLSVCLYVRLSVCPSVRPSVPPPLPPWWDHPRNFVNIEDTDSKWKLKYSLGQNATFVPEWIFLYDAPFSSYGPKCTKNDPFCMEVARKKNPRAAILDFTKNAPFHLKHLLVKRRGNFNEIFRFRAPLAAILTKKYWSEGANISTKNVWGTKIYHYELKTEKKFRGRPFWILQKMLFLTWNTFWWRDEAISMKFFVSEHLWRPFWPGNIDLRVPIYQQKCLGDQDLSLWVKNRKKFLRAAIMDFTKNAPFDLKHLFVKGQSNFDEIFGFQVPMVAILTKILSWGCQYVTNIDEIIDFWAPMAAFVSNSKHHLACKHFNQHIPHIY